MDINELIWYQRQFMGVTARFPKNKKMGRSPIPSSMRALQASFTGFNKYVINVKTLQFCFYFFWSSNIIKRAIYYIASSFTFRILGIFLVFVDVTLIIAEQLEPESSFYTLLGYHSFALAIAFFFLFDILLRVYVEGRQKYFSNWLNSLNVVIVVVTLPIDIMFVFFHLDKNILEAIPRMFSCPLRLTILIRLFHLTYQKRHLEILTRRMVSENKRRYMKDGFDLDLTYVTDRIIAMSFPSSGKQSFYRNPLKEVVRFLETKHGNHYQVYNLCSERAYHPKHFNYRVNRIMIDDHNVPSLREMLVFCMEVKKWLAEDNENIVAVHCKGGKGRTGTMICAYLLAGEIFLTAEESLFYFGERRTDKTTSTKFQGVETPSQSRYVTYFESVKYNHNLTLPPRVTLTIKQFIIYSIHGVGKGNGSDLKIQIIMEKKVVFFCSSSKNCKIYHDAEADKVIIKLQSCPHLQDDVKVKFLSSSNIPTYYDKCAFFFWFHTSFIQNNRLYLSRNDLDNPHKPKTWKVYRPEFAVEVYFDNQSVKA
ncbi:phosphatidylinositol 3,4,5-trisphosphate 3-phosphatase TPTE2-like [Sorex fumeus]|uniref:phosphatidylinositol 3,4,5-trisphosphate 3-phosphatase TPTE2-like n=1 Tax=Sorex fumeus TaxID=62283 RepID=UPI0024AE4224|nr:phosphatidylinositol 3,4,5-trisphosphate 3-phosphatase TPTE2-like [Sorex fumeus]